MLLSKVITGKRPYGSELYAFARMRAERVVAFYNQRGTAEQYIEEGKLAVTWTRVTPPRTGTRTGTLARGGRITQQNQWEPAEGATSLSQPLESTDPDDFDLPDKPKWMRWATHERLANRHDEANEKLDQEALIALSRLLKVWG